MRYTREVSDALDSGRPVVALESTLIAHGLPQPENLQIARALEEVVREEGAVPADKALVEGKVRNGLARAGVATIPPRGALGGGGRGRRGGSAPASRCSRPAASAGCTARRGRAGTSRPT